MYQPHPCFKLPAPGTTLWRYIDFAKFCSTLHRGALFFSRIDRFEDPWEATYPRVQYQRDMIVEELRKEGVDEGKARAVAPRLIEKLKDVRRFREGFAVSCWHINDVESDALWKVYARMDEGITIRSSVERLQRAVSGYKKRPVYIGEVEYYDYDRETIPTGNIFWTVISKRKTFAHEREVRAVIWGGEKDEDGEVRSNLEAPEGEHVEVDLETLVEEIVVSPLAPPWFVETVESLIERFGYSFKCRRSTLLDPPETLEGDARPEAIRAAGGQASGGEPSRASGARNEPGGMEWGH